jgi:hypothetical protein
MNMKVFIVTILMLFLSLSTNTGTVYTALEKKLDSIEYPIGADSLYYEEVNGKAVHVMFVGNTPKRLDTLSLSLENYLDVCSFYNISDAEIVYAQSCLESGHFSSPGFKEKNNHLGIKKGSRYASYNNWAECLKDYFDRIEYKKKEGESHYAFLTRIGYAEDGEYIAKVKSIVRSNRKRYKTIWESRE